MLDITVKFKGIENNLNHHKAADLDQIKHIILQNLSTPLSPILKHLFQKSLDSGTFPPIWKDASVAHVYKKGERFNPANYRLISLTCILCKTLEHIVASSITKHLSIYSMNSNMASERRALVNPSSSCWSMIFPNPSIRKRKLISFCLTSAMPLLVSHEKLAIKLHAYGIRGPALKW